MMLVLFLITILFIALIVFLEYVRRQLTSITCGSLIVKVRTYFANISMIKIIGRVNGITFSSMVSKKFIGKAVAVKEVSKTFYRVYFLLTIIYLTAGGIVSQYLYSYL